MSAGSLSRREIPDPPADELKQSVPKLRRLSPSTHWESVRVDGRLPSRMSVPAIDRPAITEEDAKTVTFLMDSAGRGDLTSVRQSIQFGVAVNASAAGSGNTALHAASTSGHAHVLSWLLLFGKANVNIINFDLQTPLHVAMQHHPDSKLIQILLDSHADINMRAVDGCTALHYNSLRSAVSRNTDPSSVSRAEYLLERGALSDVVTRGRGGLPQELAAGSGLFQLEAFLTKQNRLYQNECWTQLQAGLGVRALVQTVLQYLDFEDVFRSASVN